MFPNILYISSVKNSHLKIPRQVSKCFENQVVTMKPVIVTDLKILELCNVLTITMEKKTHDP